MTLKDPFQHKLFYDSTILCPLATALRGAGKASQAHPSPVLT